MTRGAWGYIRTDEVLNGRVTVFRVLVIPRAVSESLKKSMQQHERKISLAIRRGPKGAGAPTLSSVKKREVLP
jgi:hypothetical protein